MTEFRLIYRWDAEHWTCVTASNTPVEMYHYILNNLEAMQDASAQTLEEEGIPACFAIEVYKDKDLVRKWQGTPGVLFEIIQSEMDAWIASASEEETVEEQSNNWWEDF